MTSRIRKTIGVLALVGAILLGVGCVGGDDSGSKRAVGWGVERQLGPRSLRLAGTVEVCYAPVQLEQPIIEYEDDHVYIELRHTPEEGEGEHGGCLLGGILTLHKTITLERDLDELVLFDSSTDPPARRWPPKRRSLSDLDNSS